MQLIAISVKTRIHINVCVQHYQSHIAMDRLVNQSKRVNEKRIK